MCEKTLIDDKLTCMSESNIASALTVNDSTTLEIWNQSPQKCIEYCRGLGDEYDDEADLFAIVYNAKCTCGKGPLDTSNKAPLSHCPRYTDNRAFTGSTDDTLVTIYNANYTIKDDGEHVAPDSCWAYNHQLMFTIDDDIKKLNLQLEPGRPVVPSVDCTYSSPFCDKPLVTKKTNAPVFEGILLKNPDRAKWKQDYSSNYAYFDNAVTPRRHDIGDCQKPYHHYDCYSGYINSNKATNGFLLLTGFKITFDKEVLITGLYWTTPYRYDHGDNRYAYITTIDEISFVMGGKAYAGDFLGNALRSYDGGSKEFGHEILRLKQPVFTNEIVLNWIYFKPTDASMALSWAHARRYLIPFNFEVYGCDEFQMDAILCPEGWYSSKGYCIKAIETDQPITYTEAKDKCTSIGGTILDPYNDNALKDTIHVLNTIMQTDKKFWIGVHFGTNTFRSKDMWQFEAGVPVYEFQFPYWTER